MYSPSEHFFHGLGAADTKYSAYIVYVYVISMVSKEIKIKLIAINEKKAKAKVF
jgi:hypothetical protein